MRPDQYVQGEPSSIKDGYRSVGELGFQLAPALLHICSHRYLDRRVVRLAATLAALFLQIQAIRNIPDSAMPPEKSIFVNDEPIRQEFLSETKGGKQGNVDDQADMMRMGKVQELRVCC